MRIYITILFLIVSYGSNAAIPFHQRFLAAKKEQLAKYVQDKNDPSKFYLPARFANAPIDTSGFSNWKKTYNITSVTLVYTSFKESSTFNQELLNQQRILNFLRYNPEFNSSAYHFTELRLLEQTSCTSKESGNSFYHGFVIQGTAKSTDKTIREELSFIKSYLNQFVPGIVEVDSLYLPEKKDSSGSISTARDPKKFRCPEFPGGNNPLRSYIERNKKQPNVMNEYLYQGYVELRCYITERGEIKTIEVEKSPGKWDWMENEAIRLVKEMPIWEPAKYEGKAEANFLKISIYIGNSNMPTLVDCDKPIDAELEKTTHDQISLVDKIVGKVLKRNKHWKNYAIVCDVTGSMANYNADMMMWVYEMIQKDTSSIAGVTFFNDGDQKNDNKKKIGKTGGIYTTSSKKFNAIIELMENAMLNGGGGDIPENNLEAIIHTCEKLPQLNEIIMIADNPATPRDMTLLEQIKVPVRIILCATNGRINPDYLNIARKTKGSVHFNDQDIADLHTLQEGEVFEILGNAFRLSGGNITYAY